MSRRHHKREDKRPGRIIILAIYVVYIVLWVWLIVANNALDASGGTWVAMRVAAVGAFTFFMLFTMDFARYLFLFFLLFEMAMNIAGFLDSNQSNGLIVLPPVFWVLCIYNIGVFITLIYSKHVRIVSKGSSGGN